MKVDSCVEDLDRNRTLINRAYFTMVALDDNDHPTRVPRLELETDEEREGLGEREKAREMRRHYDL